MSDSKASYRQRLLELPADQHGKDFHGYLTFMADREQRMEDTQVWEPPITQKQRSIVGFSERFILLSGARHTVKSIGLLHAIADHLWNIPDALVAFVYVSQTNATDAGAWKALCSDELPEPSVMQHWVDGGFGMEWKEEPRFTTYSHKAYFEVTNKHGGTSRCQIFSLPREKDAADFFKQKEFTMVAITELTKFKYRKTFDILKETLRGIGRPDWHFKFLADTNPSEEGTANWIWQQWFPHLTKSEPERTEFEKQFRVIRFTMQDNPFYCDAHKEQIRQSYMYDQNEYAINVLGEWRVSSEGAFFAEQFRYNIHVIPAVSEHDDEYLMISTHCTELILGLDLGSGINHAVQFVEVCWNEAGEMEFRVLDEFVSVGLAVSIKEVTDEIVKKMDFWNEEAGRKLTYRCWSDGDIFNFDANTGNWKHQLVYAWSKGRIELMKASKGPGSVAPRLALFKTLLYANRLVFSKRCPRTINAFQTIKRDKKKSGGLIDKHDPLKHPLDSLGYAISMETGEDARGQAVLATRRDSEPRGGSGLVVVNF